MERIDYIIRSINADYNAEKDIPGPYNHPRVSITEARLLEAIEILLQDIRRLEKRVYRLEGTQICEKCGKRAHLSDLNICPACTEKWVKNR